MSRKHYAAVAESIFRALKLYPESLPAMRLVAEDLVVVFKQDNPRFERQRFLTACGLVD